MVRCTHLTVLLLEIVVDFFLRPVRSPYSGAVRMHSWCRKIVRALGVEWVVEGGSPVYGAVVSNHLSYLDILVLLSQRPFIMVAKSEVRGWPVLGWITANAGTVYVVRGGGATTYPVVNAAMAEAYRSGLPVLFFPEGTTTDGASVLPFRRGLFHSVLNEGVPLHSAALRYEIADESDATVERDICWWGSMQLVPHLWRLAGLDGVRAVVRFGGEVTERGDRFLLSESARERVMEMYAGSGPVRMMERAREAELVEAL
jgi:lyso-ornithine lipid O-acyltransferase